MAAVLCLVAMVLAGPHAYAARAVSFTLSTNRTFSPGEKPTIHLYAHNVYELEFRIYRVKDPEKFVQQLPELHTFGNTSPTERIDKETWLERFHDWKHHIWFQVRRFFRGQFSEQSRDYFRAKQASLARRSRVVGVAEFAQIPLLNNKQLVARWVQVLPPTYISDSQDLPIQPLSAGLYLVEATDGHYKAYTLLIVSRMVLITRTTPGQMLAWAVDRQTGAPVSDAQVSFGAGKDVVGQAESAADGTAELKRLKKAPPGQMRNDLWTLATKGNQVALVTPSPWSYSEAPSTKWASYVYTDRPVYRPGHTVHWKALLRRRVENHLELPQIQSIHVRVSDEQDHAIFDQDMPVTADGTVSGHIVLSATAPLGYYTISLGSSEDGISGSFHVEDYRKPEYQVRVLPQHPRVLQGGSMQVTIDSRYFFGEPVAYGKVKYSIYHSPHMWWGDEDDSVYPAGNQSENYSLYDASEQTEKTGKLGADGKLTITVPVPVDTSKRPSDQDYTIEASVTDEANREISGHGYFLATYGSYRIHVEPDNYAVKAGDTASFTVTASDYESKPVNAKVHLDLAWQQWENGTEKTTHETSLDVTTGLTGTVHTSVPIPLAGNIQIVATSETPENRNVQDTAWLWAFGTGEASWMGAGSHSVQIIADKKSYTPGDVAHLTIVSDTSDYHALIVATGYTTEFRKVLDTQGNTLSFDLPITADAQPNLDVSVVFLRNGQLYQADRQIKAPPVQQRLQVQIVRSKNIFQPDQPVTYNVYTRDAQGHPVSADLSFGVVDEAIYSIYPDESGDPVQALYPQRYVYADVESSLDYYFSGRAGLKSPLLAERKARYRPQLAQVKPGTEVQPKVRKAFPDTAYWAPTVHTDANGHARITFSFPDSLTTWRATVRAITGDSKAGSAIDRVIVRKNVIVRMGNPRFLRKGDQVTIPVIAHNYLDHTAQVQINLKVKGLDVVSGGPAQITIASRSDGTAQWTLKASQIGTATLTAEALTSEESDAMQLAIPVEPSGVLQTASRSGRIDGAKQTATARIAFPAGTDPAARSLRIQVSPSITGGLFSALDYLTSYPWGCTEQTMSSFLPNVILADTLNKLHVTGRIDPADLRAKVTAGFNRLADYQHQDGGWGWWKEDDSRVFMTAYVVSGLSEASHSYPLNWQRQQMMQRGAKYLWSQLGEHPNMLPALRAYVVFALAESGQTGLSAEINTLWSRRGDLSAEGLALTGLAMLDTGDQRTGQVAHLIESKAHMAGELVSWPSSYNPLLDFTYDDTAESTAFALRFLAHADPKSLLLPKAAQWLMLNRDNGYWWDSTEQTAMVLYGLADYLAASQDLNANFDAEVHVNGVLVGQMHFTRDDAIAGRTIDITVPAAKLQAQNTVQVVRKGAGVAYWTAQSQWYSTDQKKYQRGTLSLNLTRDYFKLVPEQQKGSIVYRLDPLRGPVQPGDTLAVHIAVSGSPTKYLFLEDPIPAGTEFVRHPEIYKLAGKPADWFDWFTRSEDHDDRKVLFASDFPGHQESYYLLKVVNPGEFAISPAHVEPMYQPEIDATSDELHLTVQKPASEAHP
ncbi:MAG TPA: alpha-2-macroglobulin family protein [Acidobacteriaceae bacterium]|nr:alpha-2-macroglobulin family protein [Acidobacteriaceae bacterium]